MLDGCAYVVATGMSIGIIYGVAVFLIREMLNIFKLSSKTK